MKGHLDQDQKNQKRRYDKKRMKAKKYDIEDRFRSKLQIAS